MTEGPKPPMEAMARPQGSGCAPLDAELFSAITALIADGKAADPTAAARILVAEGRVWGYGDPENRALRLARRYREAQNLAAGVRILSHAGGESDSIAGMSTPQTTPTAQPDLAAVVAGLAARVAELEARHADFATRECERDVMMAQLIERQCELIEAQEAAGEAMNRQAELLERYVGASEMRLAELGAPRVHSLRKN